MVGSCGGSGDVSVRGVVRGKVSGGDRQVMREWIEREGGLRREWIERMGGLRRWWVG